jgi:hypothetical protein
MSKKYIVDQRVSCPPQFDKIFLMNINLIEKINILPDFIKNFFINE